MRTDEWVVAENSRLCSTTLVRGVAGELEDENWRLGSTNVVRRAAGEWEEENWRLGSATLVRRVGRLGFFREIPCSRARCFSPYQQPKCSRR